MFRDRPLAAARIAGRTGRDWRSVHPLLVEGLKIADDLRDHADQLSGDVGNILLRQLPLLLAKSPQTAERGLELRRAELRTKVLRGMAKSELTLSELTLSELTLAELTQAEAALHGRMLELRLTLQHPDNLRHDRQDLPHHFIHVLLA